jgi:hypothetical protein
LLEAAFLDVDLEELGLTAGALALLQTHDKNLQ